MTFSSMYRPANVPRMLDFIVKNRDRLPVGQVISHKFALTDIDAAFQASEWAGGATPVVRSAIIP